MQISAIPFGILRTLIRLAAIVSMMVLVGCAQLPTSVERPESRALLSPEGTTLGAIAKASVSGPDVSGFQLLPIAYFALEARLKLADMAERTIDVQYYLLQDDVVGKTLLQALQRASLRGVRVRILIDDLYSSGEDRILEDLAAFPNVEVRLFNPFPAGRDSIESRFVASALDFDRVDHRMHNKLFVADDAIAVAGGRNMADEYFMQSESNNFVDLDVIAAGPVAQQFSNAFDLYWNSRFVYPLESITHPTRPPAERRVDFGTLTANNPAIPVDTTFPARLRRYTTAEADLNAGRLHLTEAPVRVVADPPEKAAGANDLTRRGTVREMVSGQIALANEEVFLSTPYFIPGPSGLAVVRKLHNKGVRLRVLTNSLASTDEPLVHVGYLRYRDLLIDSGVEIHELSPSLSQKRQRLGRFGGSFGRLHAKIAVIDHRWLYVGSMNLDDRSETKNTEIGMMIDSPAFANEFFQMMDFDSSTYTLRHAAGGESVEWVFVGDDGKEAVLSEEPETDFWLRMKVKLLGPFVSEGEL